MSEPMERAWGSWMRTGALQWAGYALEPMRAAFAAGYEARGAALKEWRDAAEAEADGLDEWQRAAGREKARAEAAERRVLELEVALRRVADVLDHVQEGRFADAQAGIREIRKLGVQR